MVRLIAAVRNALDGMCGPVPDGPSLPDERNFVSAVDPAVSGRRLRWASWRGLRRGGNRLPGADP